MPPIGAGHVDPAAADLVHVNAARGHEEHRAAGLEQFWSGVRKGRRIERTLSDGDIAGRGDEPGKIGVGDGVLVNPETANRGVVGRSLFGIGKVGPMRNAPPGIQFMAGGRWPAFVLVSLSPPSVRPAQHRRPDRLSHTVKDQSHAHGRDEEADDARCRADPARPDAPEKPVGTDQDQPPSARSMADNSSTISGTTPAAEAGFMIMAPSPNGFMPSGQFPSYREARP